MEKSSHSYIGCLSFVIPIILIIVVTVVRTTIEDKKNEPELVVEEYVSDTGEYIPQDQPFYINDNNKSKIGKHYVIACEPRQSSEKVNNEYVYYNVRNLKDKKTSSIFEDD